LCVGSLIFSQVEIMDNFSQNPFFCSQEPLLGVENFLTPTSYGAFQPFLAQVAQKTIEES